VFSDGHQLFGQRLGHASVKGVGPATLRRNAFLTHKRKPAAPRSTMKTTWIYRGGKNVGAGLGTGGAHLAVSRCSTGACAAEGRSRAERSLSAARKDTTRLALPILQKKWREASD